MIKVLIVDDDATCRQQVKTLIATEPNMEIIGEVTDGLEVVTKAKALKPNLVLIDLRLPGQNGLEATLQLKHELPALMVIVLTMFDMEVYKDTAIANGASDYVIKRSMLKELLPAVRRVMRAGNPNVNGGQSEQTSATQDSKTVFGETPHDDRKG